MACLDLRVASSNRPYSHCVATTEEAPQSEDSWKGMTSLIKSHTFRLRLAVESLTCSSCCDILRHVIDATSDLKEYCFFSSLFHGLDVLMGTICRKDAQAQNRLAQPFEHSEQYPTCLLRFSYPLKPLNSRSVSIPQLSPACGHLCILSGHFRLKARQTQILYESSISARRIVSELS
jgi:hypothetical protein